MTSFYLYTQHETTLRRLKQAAERFKNYLDTDPLPEYLRTAILHTPVQHLVAYLDEVVLERPAPTIATGSVLSKAKIAAKLARIFSGDVSHIKPHSRTAYVNHYCETPYQHLLSKCNIKAPASRISSFTVIIRTQVESIYIPVLSYPGGVTIGHSLCTNSSFSEATPLTNAAFLRHKLLKA